MAEDRARSDIYQAALAAVRKGHDAVDDLDRKAVRDFLDDIGNSDGRVRFFYEGIMQRIILDEDTTAELVEESAEQILASLRSFVKGEALPEELRELIEAYVGYWLDLTNAEGKMFAVLRSALNTPKLKRARERMKEG